MDDTARRITNQSNRLLCYLFLIEGHARYPPRQSVPAYRSGRARGSSMRYTDDRGRVGPKAMVKKLNGPKGHGRMGTMKPKESGQGAEINN